MSHNIIRWMFSTNAKDIGTLYLIYAIFIGLVGISLSIIIRLELASAGNQFLNGDYQLYNVIVTAHGIIMLLFVVVPGIAGFANYIVPVLIGAPDKFSIRLRYNILFILLTIYILITNYMDNIYLNVTQTGVGLIGLTLGTGINLPVTRAYIAGLIEGDGSIYTPVPGSNNYPSIAIYFALKDSPLAYFLISIFGGSVSRKKGLYVVWTVRKLSQLYFLILFINGFIRTPKIDALHKLINWFNNNRADYPFITSLGLDTSPILSNGWLAGFIDTDGNFSIRFGLSNINGFARNIGIEIRLSQRALYHVNNAILGASYIPIIQAIQLTFNLPLPRSIIRERTNWTENGIITRINTVASREILANYLANHPLLTSKRMDANDWLDARQIILSGQYKSVIGTTQLQNIKNSINTKRTYFNWDHLSNLKP